MPLMMNIKLEGLTGDSTSYSHKGWADIYSWNWGMVSNRKNASQNDGDRTTLNEMSIVKSIGSDSTEIRRLFSEGKIISTVDISIIPIVGQREAPEKYLQIHMEDVIIKSIVTGGNNEENFFKEHITLLYDRIKFEFSKNAPLTSDGAQAKSEDFLFSWDVTGNNQWEQKVPA